MKDFISFILFWIFVLFVIYLFSTLDTGQRYDENIPTDYQRESSIF